MVYRRRGMRRRSRRPFRGRARVRSMKRVAKRVINRAIETKLSEAALSGTFGNVSTTATYTTFQPSTGTGHTGRIGRVINPTYFTFRGLLHGGQSNIAADDSHNIFRICLLLVEYGFAPNQIQTNNPIDVGQGLFRQVKRVFYDRTICLNSPGRDSTGYLAVQKEIHIRRRVKFTMKHDDSGNPNKVLMLVMVSDSALPVHPGFTDGVVRMYYKDG